MRNNQIAIGFALLAAVFYAINTPLTKLLLDYVPATFMASFLYLGAGVGVGLMYAFHWKNEPREERLTRSDVPYAVAMIVLDILAPIFLMVGIGLGTASNASLLGNFEIVATTVIAFIAFREKVTVRLGVAIGLIAVASIILSWGGEGALSFSAGSLFVLLATACWGLENNCTRRIADRSTYQIVVLKGFFSGGGAFVVALALGERIPEAPYALMAMALGFVAYGLSIFLYIRAQRSLGAAKTSAYYAVAPFVGALLSFCLLGEQLTASFLVALLVMAAGAALVVIDTLAHQHEHEHSHTVTHIHDGTVHTHVITHVHGHVHYGLARVHGHHHGREELLSEVGHAKK